MNINPKIGDVVIGFFPYTDTDQDKKRPFLVVAVFSHYVWGIMLSSLDSIGQDDGSLYVPSKNEIDFEFRQPTGIRMNIFQTVHKKGIIHHLGSVTPDCLERVLDFVKNAISQ